MSKDLKELVEKLRKHLPNLDAAAIPTKCEVFAICGGEARELHDALIEATRLVGEVEGLQAGETVLVKLGELSRRYMDPSGPFDVMALLGDLNASQGKEAALSKGLLAPAVVEAMSKLKRSVEGAHSWGGTGQDIRTIYAAVAQASRVLKGDGQ